MNIIVFDGVCNLCTWSVRFIIKHDKNAYFHFVSQESDVGKTLLKKHALSQIDSIVLVQNTKVYTHSTAALEIVKHLDAYWKYLYILRFVPLSVRDFFYKQIAKYRYSIFGRKEYCMIPTKEVKERFLD